MRLPDRAMAGSDVSNGVSQATSFALIGVEARPVTVEVAVRNGYPRTSIVGLPDMSVRESRERVEAAIKASHLRFPDRRITINLSPAELPKEGAIFDLPIALAILAEEKGIPRGALRDWAIAGELSLDGSVRPVRGVLAMAMKIARESTPRHLMVPVANEAEACIVEGIRVTSVSSLQEAVAVVRGGSASRPPSLGVEKTTPDVEVSTLAGVENRTSPEADLADVRGQQSARRALEVAVAGGHNILLIGTPGGGKTLLAQRIPGILPPMSKQESLEATLVYSAAGRILPGHGLLTRRPFRAPHTSISAVGLIGGGARGPRPGEVSMAHNGVLFLDELPEFAPSTLNLLRQPLEDGIVTIVRSHGSASFPARFVLVAAMNPCPCGYLGDSRRACRCSPTRIRQYRSRISGPLLDRIDLHIEVPRVSLDALAGDEDAESSATVRDRVIAARQIQAHRFQEMPRVHANAQMALGLLKRFARPNTRGRGLLRMAADRLGFSGRAYHRILRVARTIADLEAADTVTEDHIAEAVQYRVLDRAMPVS